MSPDAPTAAVPLDPVTTSQRFQAAMKAHDVEALLAVCAPSVVLRSPISAAVRFEGHADLREIMSIVLDVVSDIDYRDEVGEGSQRVLMATARVGRETMEEAVWLRFDADGLIEEMTLFIRPLPALAAMVAALGPPLAARKSRGRAVAAAALTRPLAVMTRLGDPLALKLAGMRSR